MAQFPDVPLQLTAEAAPGADLTADPSTWTWIPLTCEHPTIAGQTISRVTADPVTIRKQALVGAVNSTGGTSSATIRLLNHDGAWTPGNPTSPLYPYVDEGLPVRLTVAHADAPIIVDTFTRTTPSGWGTSTNGITWTSSSTSSVNGSSGQLNFTAAGQSRTPLAAGVVLRNADILFDASWPVLPAGGGTSSFHTGVRLRIQSDNSALCPALRIDSAGKIALRVYHQSAGVLVSIGDTVFTNTYVASQMLRCRVRLEGDTVLMKAWIVGNTEPVNWQLETAVPIVVAGGVSGFGSLTSAVTNTMPLAATIDNLTVTALPTQRAAMFVTDIQPTFDPEAGGRTWSTATVSLGGIGSRLEKRTATAMSPMRRSLLGAEVPPYAYWPLEDERGSTQGASAFPGGPPMVVTGPAVFAFDAGSPADEHLTRYGTRPLVSLAAGATMSVAVPAAPVQTEWALSFVSQCFSPTIPLASFRIIQWETSGGYYDRFALVSSNTGYQVLGYTRVGGTTATSVLITGPSQLPYSEQLTFTIEAQQVGPNNNIELFANDVSLGSLLYGTTGIPLGAITRITLNPDAVNTTASTDPRGIKLIFGHLRVLQETFTRDTPRYTPSETGRLVWAQTAWTLEPAHLRAIRLCDEERVPIGLTGFPPLGELTLLGAQRDGAFQDLLRGAVDAESGALLWEEDHGYVLKPRSDRYDLPVRLIVDLATVARSGGTAQTDVLVPQLSSRTPNVWTIKRTSGSEGTAAASQELRNRKGTVADERTLDHLTDEQPVNHAGWRVHVGNDDQSTNYPQLLVDLAANPALVEDFKGLEIGDRAQRVNQPTVAGFGTIDQVIEGVTETISPTSWQATFDVAPASVWDVGVYDQSRRDSASTTLGVSRTSSQTSWTFTTAFRSDIWDTTASPANPFKLMCAGEEIHATAVGAASGSGPFTQTATVIRSVNGVVKAQTAGSRIRLAKPAYRAL